jgi:hypothetical protein
LTLKIASTAVVAGGRGVVVGVVGSIAQQTEIVMCNRECAWTNTVLCHQHQHQHQHQEGLNQNPQYYHRATAFIKSKEVVEEKEEEGRNRERRVGFSCKLLYLRTERKSRAASSEISVLPVRVHYK